MRRKSNPWVSLIALLILVTVLVCVCTGCGNMSLGFGEYTWEKIHIDTVHYSGCFTIEKWYDTGTGIEVATEEAGHLFLSEGTNYMMIGEGESCPICESFAGEEGVGE